jgi:hypothetical protein
LKTINPNVEPENVELENVEPGNIELENVEPGNVELENVEPGNIELGAEAIESQFFKNTFSRLE